MPKKPSSRLLFALVAAVLVFITGRNLYHRHLNNTLFDAIKTKNIRVVRILLDKGADVNSTQASPDLDYERTVLDVAISHADEIACLLIERGANIHRNVRATSTYLLTACDGGSIPLVRCLLEHGADANATDAHHDTPVSCALNSWHGISGIQVGLSTEHTPAQAAQRAAITREMLTLLRQHGARITALEAVQLEDAALLKEALETGANANQQDQNGDTALCAAATKGSLPLIRILLTHGANVNIIGKYVGPPLVTAIQQRNADAARLLLANGADLNAERGSDEYTGNALTTAAHNLPELVPDLLARHADINADNGAALRAAISANRPDVVRYLLGHGAKIYPAITQPALTTPRSNGNASSHLSSVATPSPLRTAVTNGSDCFELLIQAGADIGPEKADILLVAAKSGHYFLFARLIALGASVNVADSMGMTPLTEAVLNAPRGVQTLLAHGANPNVIAQGVTPLLVAVQTDNVDMTHLLLAHGANPDLRPPRSHTALYFARRHKNAVIMRMLEQAGAKEE